jgi:ATP-dependent Zn protease
MINKNKDLHIKIAKKLLEIEEIDKAEFDTYFA